MIFYKVNLSLYMDDDITMMLDSDFGYGFILLAVYIVNLKM